MGLITFAAEILTNFLIDRIPWEIRFPEAAKVVTSLQQSRGQKQIFFFGSSRFGNDINADVVTAELSNNGRSQRNSAFNAFVTAGDPIAIGFVTDKLLAAGIHPSVAVIELLPEVVSRHNSWLEIHLDRQFQWRDILNALPDAYWSGKLDDFLVARVNPVYEYRNELRQWALRGLDAPSISRRDENGVMAGNPKKPKNETEQAEHLLSGALKLRKRLRDFDIGGLSAQALERVIRQYRQSGTQIILIGPPVSSPYRRFYTKSVNQKFSAYMKRLEQTYATRYYDFRASLPDRSFSSVYYATAAGADQFSRSIAREILRPLLTDPGSSGHRMATHLAPESTTQTVATE
jgi:hypothetical protein